MLQLSRYLAFALVFVLIGGYLAKTEVASAVLGTMISADDRDEPLCFLAESPARRKLVKKSDVVKTSDFHLFFFFNL